VVGVTAGIRLFVQSRSGFDALTRPDEVLQVEFAYDVA
jgi:hypothetical protein